MIRKYYTDFCVFYFRRSLVINKEYKDIPDEDYAFCHSEDEIMRCHYDIYINKETQDSILEVSIDGIHYDIPINEKNWTIATSISELEKHKEFVWRVRKR